MRCTSVEDAWKSIKFNVTTTGCLVPKSTTRSKRVNGISLSFTELAYWMSGTESQYRYKQEVVRTCGNQDCFSPEHLIFSELERFKLYTKVNQVTGCWEWERSLDGGGYGMFISSGGREKSHRFAYRAFIGEIPDGLFVCHKCDNTRCCNPEHLFLGTNQDNMDDKVRKHRQHFPIGESNGRSEISLENVRKLRDDYSSGNYSYRDLATRYSISQTQVSRIIRRESWVSV